MVGFVSLCNVRGKTKTCVRGKTKSGSAENPKDVYSAGHSAGDKPAVRRSHYCVRMLPKEEKRRLTVNGAFWK
jgi:hypothetical protein